MIVKTHQSLDLARDGELVELLRFISNLQIKAWYIFFAQLRTYILIQTMFYGKQIPAATAGVKLVGGFFGSTELAGARQPSAERTCDVRKSLFDKMGKILALN
jgi:hypothetical protein